MVMALSQKWKFYALRKHVSPPRDAIAPRFVSGTAIIIDAFISRVRDARAHGNGEEGKKKKYSFRNARPVAALPGNNELYSALRPPIDDNLECVRDIERRMAGVIVYDTRRRFIVHRIARRIRQVEARVSVR